MKKKRTATPGGEQHNNATIWHNFTESRRAFYLLMFFAVVLIFNDLSVPGLASYDDCYYAQKGWEMLQGGDILTPHYAGREDFINPPLFFWMIALSFAAFGKTAFAAKFFTALCGLLTILVTYQTGKMIKSRTLGWWAAFFLSTSYIFLKSSRRAMMDVPFMLFAAAALYFFVKGLDRSGALEKNSKKTDDKTVWLCFILFGIFAGLAGLIKTVFIAFVIGIPFIFFFFYFRFTKRLLKPFIISILIALVVPGWWFAYEYITYEAAFVRGFYDKMLAGHIQGTEYTEKGPLGYAAEFGRHFWLWLPLTVWAIWYITRKKLLKKNPYIVLLFFQAFIPLFILSFAGTKTIRYVLFTFPPMLIFTAFALIDHFPRDKIRLFFKISVAFLALLSAYLIIRPIDLSNIRNIDYIKLGNAVQSGKVKIRNLNIYHYRGDYWKDNNPLLYYVGRQLRGVIADRRELKRLEKSKNNFFILVKNKDLKDFPAARYRKISEFQNRLLFRKLRKSKKAFLTGK